MFDFTNPGKWDVCAAIVMAPLFAMHLDGDMGDFLGLRHYLGLHLPPSGDYVATVSFILLMWFFCGRVRRAVTGLSSQ